MEIVSKGLSRCPTTRRTCRGSRRAAPPGSRPANTRGSAAAWPAASRTPPGDARSRGSPRSICARPPSTRPRTTPAAPPETGCGRPRRAPGTAAREHRGDVAAPGAAVREGTGRSRAVPSAVPGGRNLLGAPPGGGGAVAVAEAGQRRNHHIERRHGGVLRIRQLVHHMDELGGAARPAVREEQRRGVRARRTAVQKWMPRPSMVVRNWPIRSSRVSNERQSYSVRQ